MVNEIGKIIGLISSMILLCVIFILIGFENQLGGNKSWQKAFNLNQTIKSPRRLVAENINQCLKD